MTQNKSTLRPISRVGNQVYHIQYGFKFDECLFVVLNKNKVKRRIQFTVLKVSTVGLKIRWLKAKVDEHRHEVKNRKIYNSSIATHSCLKIIIMT